MNRINKTNFFTCFITIFLGAVLAITSVSAKSQNEVQHCVISGLLPAYTLETLTNDAHLIVYGEVKEVTDPYKIIPGTDQATMIFTDYYIEPISVLRGNTEEDLLRVQMVGGTIDNLTIELAHGPDLAVGEKYILFLYQPNMGLGYHVKDDNYYIMVGMELGVYKETDALTFESQTGLLEPIEFKSFQQAMMVQNRSNPVNKYNFRDKAIAAFKENLASGFITQDEYDWSMELLDTYGTVE